MPSASKQYIIMKASRSPSNGIAEIDGAYNQTSYNTLDDAISVAETMTQYNPVGFRVWKVGDVMPICSTVESWYKGLNIPLVSIFKTQA